MRYFSSPIMQIDSHRCIRLEGCKKLPQMVLLDKLIQKACVIDEMLVR